MAPGDSSSSPGQRAGIREPVVAVDCNGADLGPAEVAALAALAGARVLLFGPAGELGEMPPEVEVIDAPVSIAKSADPVRAARSTPEASIVQAARAVAAGRAQALVCAGGTGAALAAGLFNIKRARGISRRGEQLPVAFVQVGRVAANLGQEAEFFVGELLRVELVAKRVIREELGNGQVEGQRYL